MKKSDYKLCVNCEREDFSFRRGYCTKCYSLILKLERVEKGILPNFLHDIKRSQDFFEEAKKEYIYQIKSRLQVIKESNSLKSVTPHDLEYRINKTLTVLDGKSLGKINDYLEHYLKDNRTRAFVYQLFAKIQLLKPFKVDLYRIYDSRKSKKSKDF